MKTETSQIRGIAVASILLILLTSGAFFAYAARGHSIAKQGVLAGDLGQSTSTTSTASVSSSTSATKSTTSEAVQMNETGNHDDSNDDSQQKVNVTDGEFGDHDDDDDGGQPIFVGSIAIAEDTNSSDRDLVKLATVTPDQANTSARAAVTEGHLLSIELEVVDGYLVYTAHVQNTTGVYRVLVDAGGHGTVLSISLSDSSDQTQTGDDLNDTGETD